MAGMHYLHIGWCEGLNREGAKLIPRKPSGAGNL